MALQKQVDLGYTIKNLASSRGDAFKNIFEVEFLSSPKKLGGTPSVVWKEPHRISALSIPESVVGTADVRIRGTVVSKLSGTISQGNDLSFEIRVDNNWELYKFFYDWRELYGNRKTGIREVYDDRDDELGTILITSETADQKTASWKFHQVKLVGLGEVNFDASNGDPVAVNLQFKYSYYDFEIRK